VAATEYARIIKNQATRRALAVVGREILELASQETGEVAELLDEAERKVFLIAEKRRAGDLRPMSDLMEEAITLLDTMKKNASGITGMATGFATSTTNFGPRRRAHRRCKAGTEDVPGDERAPTPRQKRAVAVFFGRPRCALTRLLANARVDEARGGDDPNDEEYPAANELYNFRFYATTQGCRRSTSGHAAASRRERSAHRHRHLQLMHQKGKVESRQLEVSEISRALKQLSKELDVPVMALSQLNRKVDERKGGKPMLSDLRESGAIEQDADVVLFIHREEEDQEGGAPAEARAVTPVELIVAKQRNGPIGSVDLVFLSEFTRFESRARDWNG
jgi:replicative DNA helicase